MLSLASSLRDGAELYLQLSRTTIQDRERDIPGEHRELMELATSRDMRAVDALERHLRRTTDRLLEAGVL